MGQGGFPQIIIGIILAALIGVLVPSITGVTAASSVIGGGSGEDMVAIALAEWERGDKDGTQNVGGQKYWRHYGFNARVEWCGCFAGWCGEQAGLVQGETLCAWPPLAINHAQWYYDHPEYGTYHNNDGKYDPKPGDYAVRGTIHGASVHVGIVEKCENGLVYTIEGNYGDRTARAVYTHSAANGWNYYATPKWPGKSLRLIGEYHDEESVVQGIAKAMKEIGFSKTATAAVLGVWKAEGMLDPSSIEGVFDASEKYRVDGPKKSAIMKDWEGYTLNTLFPSYAGRISINKEAYKGRDGKYYPGIGLAGYTGPRASDLFDFAKAHKTEWYTLEANMGLFEVDCHTLFSYLLTNDFKNETDISTAVAKFVHCYEMPSGIPADWMAKRVTFANEMYDRIKW